VEGDPSRVLIVFSDRLRRTHNGGKLIGTGREWVRAERVKGLSRSGETCLSTLLSKALPVTAHPGRRGVLCDPRWKNEDRFARFLAGKETVSHCEFWGTVWGAI
jgi:hypothetical protein